MIGHGMIVLKVYRTRTVTKHGSSTVGGETVHDEPSVVAPGGQLMLTRHWCARSQDMPGVRPILSLASWTASCAFFAWSVANGSAPARAAFCTASWRAYERARSAPPVGPTA